jgi:Tol biopolymer transport system component
MPPPLTPETLVYGLIQVTDPQVSPDGTRVVYGRTVTDRATQQATSHLWLCDSDGGNARQLTHSGQQNGWARWSPDGAQIAFVSSGPPAYRVDLLTRQLAWFRHYLGAPA